MTLHVLLRNSAGASIPRPAVGCRIRGNRRERLPYTCQFRGRMNISVSVSHILDSDPSLILILCRCYLRYQSRISFDSLGPLYDRCPYSRDLWLSLNIRSTTVHNGASFLRIFLPRSNRIASVLLMPVLRRYTCTISLYSADLYPPTTGCTAMLAAGNSGDALYDDGHLTSITSPDSGDSLLGSAR